ncbi:hypothetical protein PsYK624_105050 [Phanerochaete sordida]|uniref:Uncharacterized protein n=1 Tax=Phanerochaete sordida TaxID=48140 RepID=A0A9P3GGF7_9APHY|nr:hypothetical protein PsYK624_105050 [Phanerochaete sordida]
MEVLSKDPALVPDLVEFLSVKLKETRQSLEESQQEIDALKEQMLRLRAQVEEAATVKDEEPSRQDLQKEVERLRGKKRKYKAKLSEVREKLASEDDGGSANTNSSDTDVASLEVPEPRRSGSPASTTFQDEESDDSDLDQQSDGSSIEQDFQDGIVVRHSAGPEAHVRCMDYGRTPDDLPANMKQISHASEFSFVPLELILYPFSDRPKHLRVVHPAELCATDLCTPRWSPNTATASIFSSRRKIELFTYERGVCYMGMYTCTKTGLVSKKNFRKLSKETRAAVFEMAISKSVPRTDLACDRARNAFWKGQHQARFADLEFVEWNVTLYEAMQEQMRRDTASSSESGNDADGRATKKMRTR